LVVSCAATSIGSPTTDSPYTIDAKVNQANYFITIFDEEGNYLGGLDPLHDTIDIYATTGDLYYIVPWGWYVHNFISGNSRDARSEECDSYIECVGASTAGHESGLIPEAIPAEAINRMKAKLQSILRDEYYEEHFAHLEDLPITPIDINASPNSSWYCGDRVYALSIP